jgi:hypothetical protein
MAANYKMCSIIIVFSMIVPLMVGFSLPAGSTEETVYETSNRANITDDLATVSEPYYGEYSGERNLYGWFPERNVGQTTVALTANYNAISDTKTAYQITTNENWSNFRIDSPDGSADWVVPWNPENNIHTQARLAETFALRNSAAAILDEDNNRYWGITYYLDTKRIVGLALEDNGVQYQTDITGQNLRIAGVDAYVWVTGFVHFPTGEYADGFEGVGLTNVVQTWSNGLDNSQVDYLLRFDGSLGESYSVQVDFITDDGTFPLSIKRDGATGRISVMGDGTSWIPLGGGLNNVFRYILLRYDAQTENKITVTGLTGMTSFITSYTQSMANTVTVFEDVSNPLLAAAMSVGNSSGKVSAFVPRSLSILGIQPVIKDSSVTMDDYWPYMNAMMVIPSVAVYGSSITIEGTTYAVTNGRITIDDIEYPIVGMQILRLDDGTYINGNLVLDGYRNGTITFDGTWLFNAYLYKVTETMQNVYYWDWGSFSISMEEFCVIGVITAGLTLIALALYGKRSGNKVLALMITAGCVAMVYMALLMGSIGA